jgi:hypothetical protein
MQIIAAFDYSVWAVSHNKQPLVGGL